MIRRVREWWRGLRDSMWLVPTVMVVVAGLLAIGMINISSSVGHSVLERHPRIFGADASGSRSMLSTIAGAMITVAGVTFSITIVAVAQASTQYTPRILRNFLRDRPSQFVLGMLVGTFVYCLVVTRTIRGQGSLQFIPGLAVLGAFVLAIASIGLLVYFIHHIASSLQASEILARVAHDTRLALESRYPPCDDGDEDVPEAEPALAWQPLDADRTGYVQSVDEDGVCALAAECGGVLRVERLPGDFVMPGMALLSLGGCEPTEALVHAANDLFTIGAYRTIDQDVAFGFRQIVDIANKALSPAMNDSTTALTCIDHLGAAFSCAARRRFARPSWRDEHGRARVIFHERSFESLLVSAVDEIRRNAVPAVHVTLHLFGMLTELADRSPASRRAAIAAAAAPMLEGALAGTPAPRHDRTQLVNAQARLARALSGAGAADPDSSRGQRA